jgi:DNA-binding NarL/FixJ family response regulator
LLRPAEIRVAFAEDHPVVRQGYISLLKKHPRIKIVGEAGDGKEALELLKKVKADILIMDLEMPVMNGDEAFTVIRKRFPEVKIIFLSMHGGSVLIANFMSKGAGGFLSKGCDIEELEKAICEVYDKGRYFNEDCSTAMCNELIGKNSFKAFEQFALTERELEILKLICKDKTNKEIGSLLSIEPRTVDFHRRNIYQKTKCKKPAALALYAVRNGIVSAGKGNI